MPESAHCIYWLLAESSPALPGEAGAFLSAEEEKIFSALRFERRRADWLLGRQAAKTLAHALPAYRGYALNQIEIINDPQGAPYIRLQENILAPDGLSISHSHGRAFCALTQVPALRLGVDLEKIEPRPAAFVEDYFTAAERQWMAASPAEAAPLLATLIWSFKEAMLKALGLGLRRDTRGVEVLTLGGEGREGWQEAVVRETENPNRPWFACWQQRGGFVLTVTAFTEGGGEFAVALVET